MTLKTHARAVGLLAAAFALSVPGAQAQTPANVPAPISKANWPADVDRQSGFRLPLPSARTSMMMAARPMIAGPRRGRPSRGSKAQPGFSSTAPRPPLSTAP